MSVKIILVSDTWGVDEYNSYDEWAKKHKTPAGFPMGVGIQSSMLKHIELMPSGTVARFCGVWVLKDVPEVEVRT